MNSFGFLRSVLGSLMISILYVLLVKEISTSIVESYCDQNNVSIKKETKLNTCGVTGTNNFKYFKINCTFDNIESSYHEIEGMNFIVTNKTCKQSSTCNYLFYEKECEYNFGRGNLLKLTAYVTGIFWVAILIFYFFGSTSAKFALRKTLRFLASPGILFKDPFVFCNFLTNEPTPIFKGGHYIVRRPVSETMEMIPLPKTTLVFAKIKLGKYTYIQDMLGLCVLDEHNSTFYSLNEDKCINNITYLNLVEHNPHMLCLNDFLNHHYTEMENYSLLINEKYRFFYCVASKSGYAGDLNVDFKMMKFLLPNTAECVLLKLMHYHNKFYQNKPKKSSVLMSCLKGFACWYQRPIGVGVTEWRRYTGDFKNLVERLNICELKDIFKTQSKTSPSNLVKMILSGEEDEQIDHLHEAIKSKVDKDLEINIEFDLWKDEGKDRKPSDACLMNNNDFNEFMEINSREILVEEYGSIHNLISKLKPEQGAVKTYKDCFPSFSMATVNAKINSSLDKDKNEVKVKETYADVLRKKVEFYNEVHEMGTLFVNQKLAGSKACMNSALVMKKNLGFKNSRGIIRDAFDIIIDSGLIIETKQIGPREKEELKSCFEKMKKQEIDRAKILLRANYFNVLEDLDEENNDIKMCSKSVKYKLNVEEYLNSNLKPKKKKKNSRHSKKSTDEEGKGTKANVGNKKDEREKVSLKYKHKECTKANSLNRIKRGFDLIEVLAEKIRPGELIKMGKMNFNITNSSIKYDGLNEDFVAKAINESCEERPSCSKKDLYKILKEAFSEGDKHQAKSKMKGNLNAVKTYKNKVKAYGRKLNGYLENRMKDKESKLATILEIMGKEMPIFIEYIELIDKIVLDFE